MSIPHVGTTYVWHGAPRSGWARTQSYHLRPGYRYVVTSVWLSPEQCRVRIVHPDTGNLAWPDPVPWSDLDPDNEPAFLESQR